jgi:Flp pilus assembly protein CpaB
MTYRIRNIGIAIALALVAALMTTFYVSNYKRSVQQGEKNVQVYVAAHDIPAGLSGADVVQQHLLQARDVARRTVVPGAISDPGQLAKLTSTQPVYAGEQVSLRRFGNVAESGATGQITGTMRAVQVPGDPNQLLAGTLQDGDHVDLVANVEDGQSHTVRIVLRNIRVIAAAGTPGPDRRLAKTDGSVLLAVRDTQVQRLFYVTSNAGWTFALRPVVKSADGPDTTATNDSVLTGRN